MSSLLRTFCLLHGLLAVAQGAWTDGFVPGLGQAREEWRALHAQRMALGEPMIGNTVPEFGIQHIMLEEPPPEAPFVQVDLGTSRAFDTVALIPAVVDFQGITQTPYAFPLRFRLDASDDVDFVTFTPLLVHTEVDFVLPRMAPVIARRAGTKARYLRLTVTKLAQVEGRWTFALAELMALEGNRNIAINAAVAHKGGTGLLPRWHSRHLTDGRTPLGPPIDRSTVPEFDALFSAIQPTVPQPWMQVDLGKELPLDEVRLHPLHARQGADVPGFAFPLRFKVESGLQEDLREARTHFDGGTEDYPNPGTNAVTLPAEGERARFVRVTMLTPQTPSRTSFALSELEVYAGGVNVSRSMPASSSGDPRREQPRPPALLTDGLTSYGRLMELPMWLEKWERREHLQASEAELESRIEQLAALAQGRAVLFLTLLGASAVALTGLLFWRTHRRHRREREAFRDQLARDMHDEIGSNLAGIAVISETSATLGDATSQDWQEINRIAHETTDAMREVLWLVGARQESGIDLVEHLQRVARRLLPHHAVQWKEIPAQLPAAWPVESRRQVFLFFKEALTNILRHARATRVELSARIVDSRFELVIQDNGRGFDPGAASKGMGLHSLRERARHLGGSFSLQSSAEGTTLQLQTPLPR